MGQPFREQVVTYFKDMSEVLTPLGASILFRRSGEAIRRAVREGYVESPFTISWTGKNIRMIELESAEFYWCVNTDKSPQSYRQELFRMREDSVLLTFGDKTYRVLHPCTAVYR